MKSLMAPLWLPRYGYIRALRHFVHVCHSGKRRRQHKAIPTHGALLGHRELAMVGAKFRQAYLLHHVHHFVCRIENLQAISVRGAGIKR